MACCDDRTKVTASIVASDISNSEIPAGDVVNTTMMSFCCMAFDKGKGGVIDTAVIKVNNDTSAALTSALKLHLFTNSGLSAQTSGSPPSLNSTDKTAAIMPISFTLVAQTTYNSIAGNHCQVPYICDSLDTYLYGFLTVDSATTFDADATIEVDLWIVRD